MQHSDLLTKFSRQSSSLIVYNESSGRGTGKNDANELHRELGVPPLSMHVFLELLRLKKEASVEALKVITDIALIMGDGGALSVVRALKSLDRELGLESMVRILTLAGGGESIVSKHLSTHGEYAELIKMAMTGRLRQVTTRPLRLEIRSENEETRIEYPEWMVGVGLSVYILEEVNRLRATFEDRARRYLALYNTVMNREELFGNQIFDSHGASDVVDESVIAAEFPWYTSRFRLHMPNGAFAIHQQIAGRELLLRHPWMFTTKLLLELVTLHCGKQIPGGLIKRTPLYGNQSITLPDVQNLAIDSEEEIIRGSLKIGNSMGLHGGRVVFLSA